jgi:hypothetical protein
MQQQQVPNRQAAEALAQQWRAEGAEYAHTWASGRQYTVMGSWPEEHIFVPRGTVMPRNVPKETSWGQKLTDLMVKLRLFSGKPPARVQDLPEHLRKKLEQCRLYSVHTRHYLRRRTWRWFRQLGKTQPQRYVPAVLKALALYEDADTPDGLALLDNWGLVHVLFHDSPALWSRPHGWTLVPDRALSELAPAPIYAELWAKTPAAFLELLPKARCRPIRQWVLHYLRADPSILARASLEELLALLQHDDAEVAALAAQCLPKHPGLGTVSVDRWLKIIQTASPAALDLICELIQTRVKPETLTLEQIVGLACSRPVPIARLGLAWLRDRPEAVAQVPLLFQLLEAPAESVRPELVRWLREVLSHLDDFRPLWLLEFLDVRFADVRAEGWAWLLEEDRAYNDVELWQRLLESPYDDVRLKLVNLLESRFAHQRPVLREGTRLDANLLRLLWATVLLNIHRGSRSKPLVVRQVVERLSRRPEEAPVLLPLLKVALRSVRGPEWRAGLTGIVHLVHRRPDLTSLVQGNFPELAFVG